jgi:hypothetical protein
MAGETCFSTSADASAHLPCSLWSVCHMWAHFTILSGADAGFISLGRKERSRWRRCEGGAQRLGGEKPDTTKHIGSPPGPLAVICVDADDPTLGRDGHHGVAGMAWDKANILSWSAQSRALNRALGMARDTSSDCHAELLPRIQTQTQTQTQTHIQTGHQRIHCVARPGKERDMSRPPPVTVVHATAAHLSLPKTTSRAFFPISSTGDQREAKPVTGRGCHRA